MTKINFLIVFCDVEIIHIIITITVLDHTNNSAEGSL